MATYPPVAPPNGANFTKILHSDTYPAIQVSNSAHKGRSILITGGSKGIGRSIALSFAKAGASPIAIADNSTFGAIESELKEAAESAGNVTPKILLLHLDVTDSSTITPAVKTIESNFGKLDILINNAGFMTPALPVVTSDEDTYWRTFEVNFKGVYLVTKAFLPLLLERGSEEGLKTIININSVAAHNLRLHASAYGTTKLAVLRFTEFLMAEEAGRGLLAYCVHPGAVMTTLAGAMPKETHAGLTDKPELAADTIVFLTQERRDWLAGRYVSSTWDMPEFIAREKEIVETDKLKVRLVL